MFSHSKDIVDRMRDEEGFASLVMGLFRRMCREAQLTPVFSASLMHDAWESFDWDIDRLVKNMRESSSPDHFKICGFAAYWLRRNSPVIALKENRDEKNLTGAERMWRDVFAKYSRAYLAFDFGYGICRIVEERREDGGMLPQRPDVDYMESICYVMKYKNLSPHAMGMVYRSLFFGNRDGVYS